MNNKMNETLREAFNKKGIFDATPDFVSDYLFYNSQRLWDKINCLGYALGYKDSDYRAYYDAAKETPYYYDTRIGIPTLLAQTNAVPILDNNLIHIPEGHYPIAGFIAPSLVSGDRFSDQHWYRLDSDETWSHKQGWDERCRASKFDAEKALIDDPLTCSRRTLTRIYSAFVGFYAVPQGGATLSQVNEDRFKAIEAHVGQSLKQWRNPRPTTG